MPITELALLIGYLLLAAGMTTAVWTIMAFQSVVGMTFSEEEHWDGMVEIDWMRFDVVHHNFLVIVVALLTASAMALVLGVLLVRRHVQPGGPMP